MKREFKAGEYVHVPAETMVWDMDDRGDVKSYLRIQSPVALMCLGSHRDYKFNDSIMFFMKVKFSRLAKMMFTVWRIDE